MYDPVLRCQDQHSPPSPILWERGGLTIFRHLPDGSFDWLSGESWLPHSYLLNLKLQISVCLVVLYIAAIWINMLLWVIILCTAISPSSALKYSVAELLHLHSISYRAPPALFTHSDILRRPRYIHCGSRCNFTHSKTLTVVLTTALPGNQGNDVCRPEWLF